MLRVEGVSSFAGGGGGAIVSGAVSPKGPRGSDSRSNSSSLETTDWPRREPGGRRREEIGEVRVVRGVDVDEEGFCWRVGRVDEARGCGVESKISEDTTTAQLDKDSFMDASPAGLIVGSRMTDTGGVFRLEARSAKGLSSSMKGEFRNGEVVPNPDDAGNREINLGLLRWLLWLFGCFRFLVVLRKKWS